jgi:aryl-alcohol dehydrogenase-like predicted oxidoreductase
VSLASLDASTWTRIGDEVEAHAQLSLAVDNGVNLVDLGSCDHLGSTRDGTPRSASSSSSSSATIFELTRGRADAYLGSWLRRSRDTLELGVGIGSLRSHGNQIQTMSKTISRRAR